MRRQRRGVRLLALILGLSLIAAGCGGDDDEGGEGGAGDAGQEPTEDVPQGGEIIDVGTFPSGPPETIDPALNVTLDAYQVINMLYDGLTEVDYSDPENPRAVGMVAESWEVNEDATEFVFTIRDDLHFSDGEEILPSSFVRGWERATDLAGDYSYLYNFIEGGEEKLAGEADTISGIEADDEAMTLTTRLSAPYPDWPYVAGFQIFSPMPSAVEDLEDQNEWGNGVMVGNGPFMLEEARSDTEIRIVPNEEWDGTKYDEALGMPEQPYLDRVIFRPVRDRETGYNSFEAGEAQVGPIPDGQFGAAAETYGTTTDVDLFIGTYYYELRWDDEVIGGEDNRLLRQAISQAIDREDIVQTVWDGVFPVSTGVTPPGVPGYEEGLCDYCSYAPDEAEDALQQWLDEGNELPDEPIRIQYNEGEYHHNVTAIIIDNLDAIGIEAVEEPMNSETYFGELSDGACIFCRAGWFGDYPTYDNFLYDLFHSDAIGGNNHGQYSSETFDQLVDEAKSETDADRRAELYREAEQHILNEDIGVVPIAYYKGDYVYDEEALVNFTQTALGLIPYERIGVQG